MQHDGALNGYGMFKIYFKLKLHFTTKYDIFKHNKTIALNHFVGRKDETRFNFIAKQLSYGKDELGRYCLANFVYNDLVWVYQSFEQSREVYEKWKAIRASLIVHFGNDLTLINRLCDKNSITFDEMFVTTKTGKHPPLFQLIAAKMISYETSVILANEYRDFLMEWEKLCDLDPLMDDVVFKLKKYRNFVTYSPELQNKIRSIISEKVLQK